MQCHPRPTPWPLFPANGRKGDRHFQIPAAPQSLATAQVHRSQHQIALIHPSAKFSLAVFRWLLKQSIEDFNYPHPQD